MTPRQANEAAAPGPRGGQSFQPTLFGGALLSNVESGRQKRARYLRGDKESGALPVVGPVCEQHHSDGDTSF